MGLGPIWSVMGSITIDLHWCHCRWCLTRRLKHLLTLRLTLAVVIPLRPVNTKRQWLIGAWGSMLLSYPEIDSTMVALISTERGVFSTKSSAPILISALYRPCTLPFDNFSKPHYIRLKMNNFCTHFWRAHELIQKAVATLRCPEMSATICRKTKENQYWTCIIEANYYLSVYNVHFKLASSQEQKILT